MKRALICGVSGQDGAYLSQLLLEKGYEVFGTSRDAQASAFPNLHAAGVFERIQVLSMAPNDFRSVHQALDKIRPDEIYNLSGQTSVGLSFEQPLETMESIAVATLHLLEAIKLTNAEVRFYNAASSESFGESNLIPADELSAFRPRSPYAIAKAAAFWQVANYREAYGLFACSGILFNHESPLRPARFVTRKIISAACRIVTGSSERLRLGNLDIVRDWGWAPEYVEAMWLILQQPTADDFVIATGESHSLRDFVEQAFACVGLEWTDHVDIDPSLYRPTDLASSHACPDKARRLLGWKAQTGFAETIQRMIAAEHSLMSAP
ncbi:GDPmannose 4,6-dehydratase [Rhodanobacter glycinis]|uniref:GDP-mannose 4,6-dehydratase n=2 Tax=Rhodanobacter glycinis TaxID=582702 RepID=A0A1I4BFA9_9GAMM|nr:GDPmannose 4,6-dehydratase [Rhodanobacter glycinis]